MIVMYCTMLKHKINLKWFKYLIDNNADINTKNDEKFYYELFIYENLTTVDNIKKLSMIKIALHKLQKYTFKYFTFF